MSPFRYHYHLPISLIPICLLSQYILCSDPISSSDFLCQYHPCHDLSPVPISLSLLSQYISYPVICRHVPIAHLSRSLSYPNLAPVPVSLLSKYNSCTDQSPVPILYCTDLSPGTIYPLSWFIPYPDLSPVPISLLSPRSPSYHDLSPVYLIIYFIWILHIMVYSII